MGYIQDEEHFINTILLYVRKEAETTGRSVYMLPQQFYLDYIYHAGRADDFTWAIRTEGVHLLEEPAIWDWLRIINIQPGWRKDFIHQLTDSFVDLMEDLRQQPGVYGFWSESDMPLYIGRSMNLCGRLSSSFQRFRPYDRPVYVRYIVTETCGDAVLLEGYFIVTLNPPLNGADNYQDGLTLQLTPIPEWSERIRCNWIVEAE